MTDTHKTGRTIHVQREQWHLAWDNSIPPIATIASGETVSFDMLDASCGQIGPQSTVEAIRTLDFSQVDQVNGPLYTGTENLASGRRRGRLGRVRARHSHSPGALLWRDRYGARAIWRLLDHPAVSSRWQYGHQTSDEGYASLPADRGTRRALLNG